LVALRRLLARDSPRLYPGHGPVVDDPRATLTRLLARRRDRERRVLAAVRAGARDPEAVLDRAYDRDLSGVREHARATVRAHLEKLAVEGRVRWAPDEGRVEPAPGGRAVDP
ncbi:MAG: MBL fold metallo-hydrolase, partial [Haloferacaceae archaeon]